MYTIASILSKCPAFRHLVKVKLAILRTENRVVINTEMERICQQFEVSLPPLMDEFLNRHLSKEGQHWTCCVVAIRWISETKVALDILWPNNRGKATTVEIFAAVKILA